jgi:hypothetical protein
MYLYFVATQGTLGVNWGYFDIVFEVFVWYKSGTAASNIYDTRMGAWVCLCAFFERFFVVCTAHICYQQ